MSSSESSGDRGSSITWPARAWASQTRWSGSRASETAGWPLVGYHSLILKHHHSVLFHSQVYDELTGCKMEVALGKHSILPRRFGGVVPDVSPVVDAAHVASAMLLEAFIIEHVGRAESSGHELPLGIGGPKVRLDQRAQICGRLHLARGNSSSGHGGHKQRGQRPCALVVAERACFLCAARCVSCWKCHGPGGLGTGCCRS